MTTTTSVNTNGAANQVTDSSLIANSMAVLAQKYQDALTAINTIQSNTAALVPYQTQFAPLVSAITNAITSAPLTTGTSVAIVNNHVMYTFQTASFGLLGSNSTYNATLDLGSVDVSDYSDFTSYINALNTWAANFNFSASTVLINAGYFTNSTQFIGGRFRTVKTALTGAQMQAQYGASLTAYTGLKTSIANSQKTLSNVINVSFKDLFSSLNTLTNMKGALRKILPKEQAIVDKAIDAVLDSIRIKCEIAKLSVLIQAGKENDPAVTDQMMQDASIQITKLQGEEQLILQNLDDEMIKAAQDFQTMKLKAENDLAAHPSGMHDVIDFFHGKNGRHIRAKAHRIIDEADKMMSMISNIQHSLSAEIGSISPTLFQVSFILDLLVKHINSVLGSDLSPGEKKKNILFLMMIALGALNQLKSQIAKEKELLQKKIAGAAQTASLNASEDALLQNKKVAILKHTAAQMQKMMANIKIAMTVIGFMFSWMMGPASLLAMSAVTGLEYGKTKGHDESIMDQGTRSLAKQLEKAGCKNADIVAQVMMAYWTTNFMVIAGVADGPLSGLVNGVGKAVEKTVENTLKIVLKQVLVKIMKEEAIAAEKIAEKVISETVERAMSLVNSGENAAAKISQLLKVGRSSSDVARNDRMMNVALEKGADALKNLGKTAEEIRIDKIAEETIDQVQRRFIRELLDETVAKAGNSGKRAVDLTDEGMSQILDASVDETVAALKTLALKVEKVEQSYSGWGLLKKLVKAAMGKPGEKVEEKAIENILRQVEIQVEKLIANNTKEFAKSGEQMANKALADVLGKDLKAVESMTDTKDLTGRALNMMKTSAGRSLYVLASQNVLVKIVTDAMKKKTEGADDGVDMETQKVLLAIQVIQALMMVMGGMMSMQPAAMADLIPGYMTKLLTVIQAASMGTNAGLEGTLAKTDELQAQIIPKIAKDRAATEGFNLLLAKLAAESDSNLQKFLDDLRISLKGDAEAAEHLESMSVQTDLMRVLGASVV